MNAEKKQVYQVLKTCKGQLEGIIKMLEDERYCIDISNQIIASQGLLKKANKILLTQHMHHFLNEAIQNDEERSEKIEEVVEIVNKLIDK